MLSTRPTTTLGREISELAGKLLDRTAALSVDTQYLAEEAKNGRLTGALKERPDIPGTAEIAERLRGLIEGHPLLAQQAASALSFYSDNRWAGFLRQAEQEEIVAALRDEDAFLQDLRAADEGLRETALLADRIGSASIPRLAGLVDEESYEAIVAGLGKEVASLRREELPSYNKVYHARTADGKNAIVKVTGNALKARIEAAANYHLSRHEKLAPFIAAGLSAEPIPHENLSITIQEEIADARLYGAHHYMAALAHLHAYGKGVLDHESIVVPEWRAKDLELVMAEIDMSEDSRPYRSLSRKYKDLAEEIRRSPEKALLHGDAKADNLRRGRLLDLEGMRIGDPAIDLALYLSTSAVPGGEWGAYVETYLATLCDAIGSAYTAKDIAGLLERVQRVMLVPVIKEYGGLCSRRPRWSAAEERQHALLGQQLRRFR